MTMTLILNDQLRSSFVNLKQKSDGNEAVLLERREGKMEKERLRFDVKERETRM